MLAFVTMLTTGCKNKCGTTTCQNGGSCESNICICPRGYSGSSCQNSWSSAVVGTYTCTNANCNPATASRASWQSVVTADATNGGYTVDITNFDGNNTTVVANVDSPRHGLNVLTISNSIGINANGSYDSATQKISLHYGVYTTGVSSYTCDMIMSRIH